MKDFEDFLKENRLKLKKEVESESDLWYRIDSRLQNKKQLRLRRITAIAASLALMLALTAIIKVNRKPATIQLPLYSYSEAYGNTEAEYVQAIAYQTKIIRTEKISADKVHELQSFLTGLKALNEAYDEYQKIIKKDGCNEIMLELVIDNYKRRIELLQCLQDEITKINNYEDDIYKKQTTLSL